MRLIPFIIITLSTALLLIYNNCAGSSNTRFTSASGTVVIGNPLAPATNAILMSICGTITRCNQGVTLSACQSGVLGATGIGPDLGFPQSYSAETFSALIQVEQSGTVVANGAAANQCATSINNLSCSSSQVQSAYNPISATPFSGVATMIPSTSPDCSNVFTTYNGVIAVSSYGDAPNAPIGTPTSRQVSITWNAFTGAATSTQYKLVRVAKGQTIDLTTTMTCTSSIVSSCLVCTASGTGNQTCSDSNIASPPQQYDYVVADSSNLPTNPTRITVAIPPPNMVLVQRDAANYEMCNLLGQKSDPFNHQRCPYSGLGAVPFNSNPGNAPLNLPNTYYDFGYNLFVDRWTAACNWTPSTGGGICGTNHSTSGNCFGNGAPSSSWGATGNVYYDFTGGACYYYNGSNWIAGSSASPAQYQAMYTVDPGANSGHRPPFAQLTQSQAWNLCNAVSDPNYGPKRLLRHREYIAAAAWPWLPGEPGALTDAQISSIEGGDGTASSHTSPSFYCNSDNHSGITLGAFGTTELAGDSSTKSVNSFNIGSTATSHCVSRFGMQDFAGNNGQFTSETFTCNSNGITYKCSGGASLDSGNLDTSSFQFNGVQGPGGSSMTQWVVSDGLNGATNFSLPLGLPLAGNDGGNAIPISSFGKLHDDAFYLYTNDPVVNRAFVVGGGVGNSGNSGRWDSSVQYYDTNSFNYLVPRCAVSAE